MLIVLVSGLLLLLGVVIGIVIGSHLAGRGSYMISRDHDRQPQGVTVNVVGSAYVGLAQPQNTTHDLEVAGRQELPASPRRVISEPYNDPFHSASADPYSLPSRSAARSNVVPSRVIREIGRDGS